MFPSIASGERRPVRGPATPVSRRRPWTARLWVLLVLAFAAACGQGATEVPAPSAPAWLQVRLEGELDVGSQALLERAVAQAKRAEARTLVVEIDTPGGALDVLWVLQKQLYEAESAGVETVAWVNRHATSAGALVTLACKRIYMHSAGTIGSALPVVVGPEGLAPIPDEAVREKEISFLRSQFASAAEKHGRSAALAAAMVDPDAEARLVKVEGETRVVSGAEYDALREKGADFALVESLAASGKLVNLTAKRAVELRMADGLADDEGALFERAGLAADARLSILEKSRSEEFIAWLARLTPLLLMAGLVLGWLELKSPGFGVPGVLSIACFVLILVGKYFAGLAEVPHLVAVGAGVVLLIVELFVLPGTIWFGVGGLLLIVGGLALSGGDAELALTEPFARDHLLSSTFQVLAAAAAALVVAMVVSRLLPKTPGVRRVVLAHAAAAVPGEAVGESRVGPGAVGTALTDLRPVGKVRFGALDEHEARSEGPHVDGGARVVVVSNDMGRLVVREVAS